MNRILQLVFVAVLPLTMHAVGSTTDVGNRFESAQVPGVPTDATPHEGTWKPIAAAIGGIRVPPPALKAITLRITGGNYEVTVEGEKEPDKGTYTLDLTTTPKRMIIKSTGGPNRGKTFLAIYEMKDAGSLRVCYDLSGTDFPKEFKAPKGSQHYLVGYRRPRE